MNTALVAPQSVPDLWDPDTFEHAQRIGKLFASSMLIPDHMRGKLPDVTIALLMARRLAEDPLIVMQNMHLVSGKAGWSAQYVIARANRSGVFKGRINWREAGDAQDLEVTAYATLAETGEEVSFPVSMQMARDEGWTRNSKYKSMPRLMLRYRSAVLLVRLYAPEVMLGYSTVEELEDITPQRVQVMQVAEPARQIPDLETAGSRTQQLAAALAEPEPEPQPAADPDRTRLRSAIQQAQGALYQIDRAAWVRIKPKRWDPERATIESLEAVLRAAQDETERLELLPSIAEAEEALGAEEVAGVLASLGIDAPTDLASTRLYSLALDRRCEEMAEALERGEQRS